MDSSSAPRFQSPSWAGAARDLVTAGLGVWLVAGIFLDGWAHLNTPSLETFFTPLHAVLYSGLEGTPGTPRPSYWSSPASGPT